MRPFDVSTAMFAVSACVLTGAKVPPELLKIIYEYVEKLEATEIELAQVKAERDTLKEFIKELFVASDWPLSGDVDGADFQNLAVKYGMLTPEKPAEPCGEGCNCAEYYSSEEFADGIVTCYRLAAALKEKGEPKSP